MAVPQNSTVRWFHSEMSGAPQIGEDPESILAIFDACLIDGFGTLPPDGNKIAVAGGVATVEFSGGHDFEEFAVIEIEGATPAGLNDAWRVTGATATTFTFDCPGIPDGNATGSITVKRASPGHWEKPFADANRRAFRSTHPEATGCFLFLGVPNSSPAGYTFLDVRGYEDMADLDTGIAPFPDVTVVPAWTWTFRRFSSGPRRWALFADEKTLYVYTKFASSAGAGGTLRLFGDFKSILNEAYNCGITGYNNTGEYEPGRTDEHELSAETIATPRDEAGANPGTHWLGRMGCIGARYLHGGVPHPAINGGYLFSGPVTISKPAGSYEWMPRGSEPALYLTPSDETGLMGQPNTKLDEGFKVLSRAEGIGRAVAVIRTAHGGDDYESGCLGIDIEGPWG